MSYPDAVTYITALEISDSSDAVPVALLGGLEESAGQFRMVGLPREEPESVLDAVFQNGQNDFQPQRCRSVMVGDVVLLPHDGTFHMVAPCGFREMTRAEFNAYRTASGNDRWMQAHQAS